MYADIAGYRNSTGRTLDPALALTLEKPDLVILDTQKSTIDICELTAGHENNISKNHRIKDDRHAWMLSDITAMKPTHTLFEVGCRGFVTPENKLRFKYIYTFCKTDNKLKLFLKTALLS